MIMEVILERHNQIMKLMRQILLAVMLSLFISANTTIFVNAANVTISIDGIVLSEDNPYWKNGDRKGSQFLSDWNAYYQASKGILILKDAEIYGRVNVQDSDIYVQGSSVIYGDDVKSGDSIAISGTNITIICEGTLTAVGGKSGHSGISAGIYSEGSLTISGGGTVITTAENEEGNAYGIYAVQNLFVDGCDISSKAKSISKNGYGIVSRYGATTIQNSKGSSIGSKSAFFNEPTFFDLENLNVNGIYTEKTMSWSKKSATPQKEYLHITFEPQSFTFGDSNIGFRLSDALGDSFCVEYQIENEWSLLAPQNAGAYDVRISRAEDERYFAFEAVINCGLEIKKKSVAVPQAGTKNYTGQHLESDLQSNDIYTVVQDGGMSVGKYEVHLILCDSANYTWENSDSATVTVLFEIIGTPTEITDVFISDWTYGDEPSKPTAKSTYGEIQFAYYDAKDRLLDGVPKNAGAYKLRAYVSADGGNYETVYSDYVTFNIHKAKVEVPNAGKKTYTGKYLASNLKNTHDYAVQNNGGISVGTYEVVLMLKEPSNYIWSTGEELKTIVIFEIVGIENQITDVSISDWIYGEISSIPSATSIYGQVQFEYYDEDNRPIGEVPTNAGIYKLRAYVLGDGENYETVYSDYVTFCIHKVKVEVPDAGKKMYTGQYLESDLVSTDIYSVQKQGGIAVGEYQIVLTLADPRNYEWIDHGQHEIVLEFQIIPANNAIGDVTIIDWTYGDAPNEPFAESKYGIVQYEFFDEAGVKINSAPTQSGSYQVRAVVIGDGENYNTVYSALTTFQIYPKIINAPERLETKSYTGELLKSNAQDTDIYQVTKNDGGINIGRYAVELTLRDSKNYRWSTTENVSLTVFFEIAKITNMVSDTVIPDWTYGEEPGVPFAAAKIGNVQFRYFDKNGAVLTSPPCDAGEYCVKAYVPADGDNYEEAESQNFTYFTIHKKSVDVPKIEHKVYNGMYQESDLPETEYYTVLRSGGVDADIYHVTLSLRDTRNYYWSTGDETKDKTLYFHIEKNNTNSIGSFYVKDSVYGEEREEPHAVSVFGDVRFTYSDAYDGDYTTTVPKKAGTWYVKATVTNTKNYNGCSEIRVFTVKKAVVAYPENAGYKVYNGERLKSDLRDTEFYTVGVNRGGKSIGDYEVVLRLKDTENTVWQDGTTDEKTLLFSILETKNVISDVVIEDFVYGETFVYPYATALFGEVQYEYYDATRIPLDRFPVNAGVYMARAFVVNGNGEAEYSENFTAFEIHKAKVPMPMADSSEFVYNGEMHRYFVEESPLYSVINDRRTRVGSQKVTVMLNDKENYVWENGSSEDLAFTFTVINSSFSDRIDGVTDGEGFTTEEIVFLGICAFVAAGGSSFVIYRRFYKKRFTKRQK